MKIIPLLLLSVSPILFLSGCNSSSSNSSNPGGSSVVIDDADTHYLKFIEENAEILRMVVLEGETYEDLLPYFPTLNHTEGFIEYWDGDYTYTDYSKENQFKVWDKKDKLIEIYSYKRKAN